MSNRSMSLPRGEPEVHVIQLHKSNSGMGLSIVATKVSTLLREYTSTQGVHKEDTWRALDACNSGMGLSIVYSGMGFSIFTI